MARVVVRALRRAAASNLAQHTQEGGSSSQSEPPPPEGTQPSEQSVDPGLGRLLRRGTPRILTTELYRTILRLPATAPLSGLAGRLALAIDVLPTVNEMHAFAAGSVRSQTTSRAAPLCWALGVACSTVDAVLRRGLNRLDRLHRVTRESVRNTRPPVAALEEAPFPTAADTAPTDAPARPHADAAPASCRRRRPQPLAYETLPDEPERPALLLERALAHFRTRGVAVRRVLTDNAGTTVARVFLAVADANGLTLKLTRPYRPQTNGKAERFIQTLASGPTLARTAPTRTSAPAPALALPLPRRPRRIGGVAPASRLSWDLQLARRCAASVALSSDAGEDC